MRDNEFLRQQIEKARKKDPEPIEAADYCDICPNWSEHLLDGLCPTCRGKFHLNYPKGKQ